MTRSNPSRGPLLSMGDARTLVAAAVKLHQHGRYEEAESLYREALRVDPLNFDALQLLGALMVDTRNYDQGVALIRNAIGVRPSFAKAHVNLGVALAHLGRYTEAISSYDRALALVPKYAEAFVGRANAHTHLGHTTEALSDFDQALTIKPDFVQALNNKAAALYKAGRFAEVLGTTQQAINLHCANYDCHLLRADALRRLERNEEAIAAYDHAITLDGRRHEAFHGRGRAWYNLRSFEEAAACVEQAIELGPEVPELWSDAGSALAMLGHLDAAMLRFERALQLEHDSPRILSNRGLALLQLRRFSDALDSFDKALAYDPGDVAGLNNSARALLGLDRFERAIAGCDLALLLEPDNRDSLQIRAVADTKLRNWDEASLGFGRMLELDPLAHEVRGLYMLARLYASRWEGLEADSRALFRRIDSGDAAAVIPLLLSVIECDPAQQLAGARAYADSVISQVGSGLGPCGAYSHPKIRVAYVSADFREHPVGRCIVQLLEQHDRSRFEVIGIALGPGDKGDLRRRIEAGCDVFRHVDDRSDVEVAKLLRDLEVDIAVDLMGYTDRSRSGIFAHRAAPVQVNFMGYPGTLGAPFMDYIIADEYVIPPELARWYDERIVRLPDCYFVHDVATEPASATPTRADEGLPDAGFVFCCFNSAHKFNPRYFSIWMRLLQRVEGAVLWLQGGNQDAEGNLCREAKRAGVDPARLVFSRRAELIEDHLARQRLGDLFLDTAPYNAHSTARDALWAGLPVLTCEGATFAGRVAGSLVRAAGIPELVAQDEAHYESLALQLALRPEELMAVRGRLAASRGVAPLFDMQSRTRHLEAAFTRMHAMAVRNEAPQAFDVG